MHGLKLAVGPIRTYNMKYIEIVYIYLINFSVENTNIKSPGNLIKLSVHTLLSFIQEDQPVKFIS